MTKPAYYQSQNDWCLSLTLNCLHNWIPHYKYSYGIGLHIDYNQLWSKQNHVDDLKLNHIYLHIFFVIFQSIKQQATNTGNILQTIQMTLMVYVDFFFFFGSFIVLSLIDISLLVIILHLIPSFGIFICAYQTGFFYETPNKSSFTCCFFFILSSRWDWRVKELRAWLTIHMK